MLMEEALTDFMKNNNVSLCNTQQDPPSWCLCHRYWFAFRGGMGHDRIEIQSILQPSFVVPNDFLRLTGGAEQVFFFC